MKRKANSIEFSMDLGKMRITIPSSIRKLICLLNLLLIFSRKPSSSKPQKESNHWMKINRKVEKHSVEIRRPEICPRSITSIAMCPWAVYFIF